MAAARPLKDVFAELTGDDAGRPEAALADGGHGDLPADLVAEAVVSYADTAPTEVAEHLSPFVMAHSGVPVADEAADDPADWSDLLASAPVVEAGLDDGDNDLGGPDTVDGPVDGLGGPDTVDGLGGPDTVDGLGGPDTVDGDDAGLGGPDTVDGLGGPDTVDDVHFGDGAARTDLDDAAPGERADAPEIVDAPALVDAPDPQEFDGEVFDTAAPVDLSDVDDLDGDDVDPADLDG